MNDEESKPSHPEAEGEMTMDVLENAHWQAAWDFACTKKIEDPLLAWILVGSSKGIPSDDS